MKIKLEFSGRVLDDGTIELPKTMRKQIAGSFKGKRIKVRVEQLSAKHSDAQRGYYRACFLPALIIGFNQTGEQLQVDNKAHLDMMHEFCKERFLKDKGREIVTPDGQILHLPASTEDLNKDQYGKYLDDIAQWAAEYLNIVIPEPGEQVSIF